MKLPSWATIALSAVATAVAVLNQATGGIGLGQPWDAVIAALTASFAVLGISPLAHQQLMNFIHLPYRVALALGTSLGVLATAVTTLNVSTLDRAIIIGVLTAAAGVLSGPQSSSTSSSA